MLNLADLLKPHFVFAELSATTKAELLEELCGLVCERADGANGRLDKSRVLEVLLEREGLGSTGIGEGVALPHGKLEGLEDLMLGLGRSRAGVDFEAADGRPARLFFLLLSPEGSTRHLHALAALARLLRQPAVCERLLAAESAEAMYQEMLRALSQA